MKITNVRAWLVKIPWDHNVGAAEVRVPGRRGFIFVQVDTDEGITGWGEVTTYPGPVANRAVAAYIDQIGAWLVGEDPANIEAIWGKVFRGLTYVGTRGATTAAISGIDIALWDILGKVARDADLQTVGRAGARPHRALLPPLQRHFPGKCRARRQGDRCGRLQSLQDGPHDP